MNEESNQFLKRKNEDILRVVGHRGAVSHTLGCAILQLSVVATEEDLSHPKELMLAIHPEEIEKLIASLRQSANILRQSN